jgi:hypothetical protein
MKPDSNIYFCSFVSVQRLQRLFRFESLIVFDSRCREIGPNKLFEKWEMIIQSHNRKEMMNPC